MSGCKPIETPKEQSHKLNEGKGSTLMDKERYQCLMGNWYIYHTQYLAQPMGDCGKSIYAWS